MYKYTAEAEQVIKSAEKHSIRLKNYYIGTEHIFIGLLDLEDSTAVKVLNRYQIGLEPIQTRLEGLLQRKKEPHWNEIIYTPRTKKILKMALEEAYRFGGSTITPDHLLFAILREGNGVAARLLNELDIDLKEMVIEVQKVIASSSAINLIDQLYPHTPLLNRAGRDLTMLAKQGKLAAIIGRQQDINRLIKVLIRPEQNNPILIGPTGIGKTSLVERLANDIALSMVPLSLTGKRIIDINLSMLIPPTQASESSHKLEDYIIQLIEEAKNEEIILFMSRMNNLFSQAINSPVLKRFQAALISGEIQCIGTAHKEHLSLLDEIGLKNTFQHLYIDEISPEESIMILKGLASDYKKFHKIEITDEAIERAVDLATRYIKENYLPYKAIEVINRGVERIKKSTSLSDMMDSEILEESRTVIHFSLNQVLNEKEVIEIVAEMINIPSKQLEEETTSKLIKLESILTQQIICQDKAISIVARTLRQRESEVADNTHPRASFIFTGSQGVGKSALAKVLTSFLFGDTNHLLEVDLIEYGKSGHTLEPLATSFRTAKKYKLNDAIQREPRSVIIFRGLEHTSELLMQRVLEILNNGHTTSAEGKMIDFTKAIIIILSNYAILTKKTSISEKEANISGNYAKLKENAIKVLKNHFPMQIIESVHEIVIFSPLEKPDLLKIIKFFIERIPFNLYYDQTILNFLLEEGYYPKLGAKPFAQLIEQTIIEPLAKKQLNGEISFDMKIYLYIEDEELCFKFS